MIQRFGVRLETRTARLRAVRLSMKVAFRMRRQARPGGYDYPGRYKAKKHCTSEAEAKANNDLTIGQNQHIKLGTAQLN